MPIVTNSTKHSRYWRLRQSRTCKSALQPYLIWGRPPINPMVWKHDVIPKNRKYITYRNAATVGPSHGHSNMHKNWYTCSSVERFLIHASGHTDRPTNKQTNKHARHNTSHPCRGRSDKPSVLGLYTEYSDIASSERLKRNYCVTFASQRVSLNVIPFCLSAWMSVGHSATYSLPRLIDHNQIWWAGIYLSSDPRKPFWIPYLPYFGCQRENMQNFAYFQRVFLPVRTWRIVPYDLSSSKS